MITKTINLYKFNELSDTAKETARIQYHNEEDHYMCLEEDILEYSKEQHLFNIESLSYSLSNSQGDGLCFSSTINLDDFINAYPFKDSQKKVLIANLTATTEDKRKRACYYYSSPDDVEVLHEFDYDKHTNLLQLATQIEDDLEDAYAVECARLESYGYNFLSYPNDIEEMEDLEMDSDNLYTIDGIPDLL